MAFINKLFFFMEWRYSLSLNIQLKHLSVNIAVDVENQIQRIYLHLWQKALEFNLKGMIHVQEQIITVKLEGAEHTIAEFIHVIHAITSADFITMTLDNPFIHYETLTTNVW